MTLAAMLAAILLGILAGLAGVLVELRSRAFFAMSLTHATFPGVVLATMVGVPAVLGAGVAAALLLPIAVLVGRMRAQGATVASGLVVTLGFALGSLLASLQGDEGQGHEGHGHAEDGHEEHVELANALSGTIETADFSHVAVLAVVLALVTAVWMLAGRSLIEYGFDAGGYRASGRNAWVPEALTLGVIAIAIVVAVPLVGSLLGLALLVAPAAAARLVANRVPAMLIAAAVLGPAIALAGLALAAITQIAAGACIALIGAAVVAVTWLARTRRPREAELA